MSTYRSSVASFVPALIRSQALEGTEFLAEPGLQRHACGLLFADISGFTQLTEQLAQRGPAGAEELTALLNRYFGTIIDTLEASGGDVLKFAGDALLAVWPAQILALSMETTLARIVDVARVLQSTLHDYQVTPGVRLSMKLAIGAGEVDVEHLGGVFDRWEFLVSGKPLAHLGRANDAAEPGQIVLSAQAAQLLPTRMVDLTRLPGDLFLFDDASRSPELVDAQRVEEPLDGKQTERLLSFLPAAIRQRVAAGYADWLSELRQVSVVFMNLPGYGVDTSLESAQAAMRAMQVALYRYEGSINKLSVDDKGVSLIAVLGLPPLSHTDDPERALRASLDMREGLAELGLHCSTGVCTGIAFCGVVGNDRRREYTVMGDTVNLSARLMQAADGGVLCDSPTRRAVGGRMNFAARNPLRVKGKAAPVEVFVPTHSAGSVSVEAPRFLQGRARERRWLDALLNEALAGDAGVRLQRVCVSADGGLGKWSLVAEMLSRAERERAEVLVVVGDPLDTLTPFRAWRGVFLSLLGLADEGKAERATEASILERLPNAHARNFAPLLGDVVPVPLEDNQYTQALRGEDRREHALKLLTDLVCRHAELGPTVLAVKDGHLVDASSWDLLNRVDEDAPGLLIVVTVRPGSAPASEAARGWLAKSYTEHLELGELNDESLLALARQRLGVRTLAPALGDLLVQRCAGNPLYCEELTTALRDGGALEIDGDEAALSTDVSDASQVPASLHGLISSRIDRLSASAQMTLKIASVIGRVFAVQLVSSLHPGNPDPRDLADDLRHLVEL
ncbi:MAG: hypothetical protein HOI95_20575, partial [Chromatiales bacterium]|nr:hypothetical protein [Chromatiales bacterium]